jgi:DNA-binding LacI/PurR family transcriptional regulator
MSDLTESRKRTTLADVAHEAGVSVQTASHVLSGNLKVRLPESTRQRVREAAVRVGYRPNRLAQAMKLGKTQMISVWMPLDRITPNYFRFLQAISQKAQANDYDLMITGLDRSVALEGRGRRPYVWPVDGVISLDAGKAIQFFRDDPSNDGIPVVVLGLESFANSDSVSWDVAGAAREATERLIARGCGSILHITLDWILRDFPREQRRRGYMEAMKAAGLEPAFLPVESESSALAEVAVTEYLRSNPTPDAFFGFTDPLAIGAARALVSKGIPIPHSCLVWGFGDFPESDEFRVPISTIRTPIQAIVEQAWNWLTERMLNGSVAPRLEILPMELVERESTTRK